MLYSREIVTLQHKPTGEFLLRAVDLIVTGKARLDSTGPLTAESMRKQMKKSEVKKRETIDRILKAAAREIQNRGIDGARISVIADEAGVTKQLVYHYFESKDQMYVAILEAAAQGMRLTRDVEVYDSLTPDEAIRKIIDTIFSGFARNPSYTVLALDQALHQGEHISNRNDFAPSMKSFVDTVFPVIIKRGQQQGVFREDLDTEVTFWFIFNLIASCFLNKNIINRITQTDFYSSQGLEKWRMNATDFILNALRR
jgi:TetR/AcrR family transcriptional regulator